LFRGIAAVVADALPGIGRAPASAGARRLPPLRARPAPLGVSVGEQQSHDCDTEQNKTDRAHAVLLVHLFLAASSLRARPSQPRASRHSRASACDPHDSRKLDWCRRLWSGASGAERNMPEYIATASADVSGIWVCQRARREKHRNVARTYVLDATLRWSARRNVLGPRSMLGLPNHLKQRHLPPPT
jgi:hypothetical protein